MLYGVGLNYNGTSGVMKGSDRDVFSFNLDLRYRKGKLRFDNKFTLDYGEANNAPQSFAVYVQTNPYYEKDYEGSIPKYLEESEIRDGLITEVKRPNPLYNASLNYLDCTRSLAFRDNFQIEVVGPCERIDGPGTCRGKQVERRDGIISNRHSIRILMKRYRPSGDHTRNQHPINGLTRGTWWLLTGSYWPRKTSS